MHLLQQEKKLLLEEQRRLARERELERETCSLLRTHNQVRAVCVCVCACVDSLYLILCLFLTIDHRFQHPRFYFYE